MNSKAPKQTENNTTHSLKRNDPLEQFKSLSFVVNPVSFEKLDDPIV